MRIKSLFSARDMAQGPPWKRIAEFAFPMLLGGVMRGAGDTVTPMWISIISTIFLRVPTAYLMAALTKNEAYPNGQPVSI